MANPPKKAGVKIRTGPKKPVASQQTESGSVQSPPAATGALQAPKDYQQYLAYRAPDFKAIQNSWVDDVVRRRGISVYEEMLYDAQVSSSLDLLKFAILSLEYSIAPPAGYEEDPEAQKAADLARQQLGHLSGGFQQFCYEALSCLDYGYSITETLWESNPEAWTITGHHALPPALYGFGLADNGDITSVRQYSSYAQQTAEYGLEHFFIMRWNPRFGGPYGRSQLRKAFEPYWMKQLIRRMRNTTLDRFGAPLVFFKVPNGTGKQDRDKLKKILENLHAESGAVIDENYDMQLVAGEGGASASGFQESLLYEDAQIAKAITGVSLNANESMGPGTYSQSKVHQDNFLYYVEYGSEVLAQALTSQILSRLCEYNLGTPQQKRPVLSFEPVRDNDVAIATMALQTASQLNILAPDKEFQMMRDRLGLPAADDDASEIISQRAGAMLDAQVEQTKAQADQVKAGAAQAQQANQQQAQQPSGPDPSQADQGDAEQDDGEPQDQPAPPDDEQDYSKWLRGFAAHSRLLRRKE